MAAKSLEKGNREILTGDVGELVGAAHDWHSTVKQRLATREAGPGRNLCQLRRLACCVPKYMINTVELYHRSWMIVQRPLRSHEETRGFL